MDALQQPEFAIPSCVVLLCLSALFSGCTLGLLSLDKTDLEVVMASGSPKEQHMASVIYPLRRHGNQLLVTLLLGNVSVNSLISILLADLTDGVIGFVISTMVIVLLGEIAPQASFQRHALLVGSKVTGIIKVFFYFFFVLSWPVAKFLDWMLGQEVGTVYNKRELRTLMDIHLQHSAETGITRQETVIMNGALLLQEKRVKDVMVPIKDAFVLSADTVLDADCVDRIWQTGHSRIPVFDSVGPVTRFIGYMMVRDFSLLTNAVSSATASSSTSSLALEAPAVAAALGAPAAASASSSASFTAHQFCELYGRKPFHVRGSDTCMSTLQKFRGGVSHLALVHASDDLLPQDESVEGSPVIGILTMEDVLEELLQEEIVDETDIFVDVARKVRVGGRKNRVSVNAFSSINPDQPLAAGAERLTEAMRNVVQVFLSQSCDAFKKLRDADLLWLLSRACLETISLSAGWDGVSDCPFLYRRGEPTSQFTLLLKGRVRITSGADQLVFVQGPWTMLGARALQDPHHVADFDASCCYSSLLVLKVSYDLFQSALMRSKPPSSSIDGVGIGSGEEEGAEASESAGQQLGKAFLSASRLSASDASRRRKSRKPGSEGEEALLIAGDDDALLDS